MGSIRIRRWAAGLGATSVLLAGCEVGPAGVIVDRATDGSSTGSGEEMKAPPTPLPDLSEVQGLDELRAMFPELAELPDTAVPEPEAPAPEPVAPAPPVAPEPVAPVVSSAPQHALLDAVNATRTAGATCGSTVYGPAAPLTLDSALAEAAQRHATDMAENDFLSHTGSDGSTAAERVREAGYDWQAVGENVAAGQTSVEQVVAGWFASATHCANFMSPALQEVGFGRATSADSTYGTYWAAALGTEA